MGAPEWEVSCDKVKRIEEEYAKSDYVVDLMTDEFIIRVGDDTDDDEDSSDSDDNEDVDGESSNDNDEVIPSTCQRTGIQLQHQQQQHALHFSTSQDEVSLASNNGVFPISISQDDLMEDRNPIRKASEPGREAVAMGETCRNGDATTTHRSYVTTSMYLVAIYKQITTHVVRRS
ncbi:hypothetical protein EVAR_55654_1 [Eumeta japonica]|uniref:Uncharacterized protein n=1 Tax=Eumeta variegata TaxID=151549 RepID=A0A4C1XX36_EUMVA|nr:hypothetical protein EVAR_55654_1 [Eumeta japonica]